MNVKILLCCLCSIFSTLRYRLSEEGFLTMGGVCTFDAKTRTLEKIKVGLIMDDTLDKEVEFDSLEYHEDNFKVYGLVDNKSANQFFRTDFYKLDSSMFFVCFQQNGYEDIDVFEIKSYQKEKNEIRFNFEKSSILQKKIIEHFKFFIKPFLASIYKLDLNYITISALKNCLNFEKFPLHFFESIEDCLSFLKQKYFLIKKYDANSLMEMFLFNKITDNIPDILRFATENEIDILYRKTLDLKNLSALINSLRSKKVFTFDTLEVNNVFEAKISKVFSIFLFDSKGKKFDVCSMKEIEITFYREDDSQVKNVDFYIYKNKFFIKLIEIEKHKIFSIEINYNGLSTEKILLK